MIVPPIGLLKKKSAAAGITIVGTAAATEVGNNQSTSIGWPSGHQTNDIAIFTLSHNHTTGSVGGNYSSLSSISSPTNPGNDNGANNCSCQVYWQRATSGSMSSISFGPNSPTSQGFYAIGTLIVFRGCVTSGNPYTNVGTNSGGGFNATASSATVSILSDATTILADSKIFWAIADARDSASSNISSFSWSGGPTNITLDSTYNTSTNSGGGMYYYHGDVAANKVANTFGSGSLTFNAAAGYASVAFALLAA